MANPNRALANLPKDPYEQVYHFDDTYGYDPRDELAAKHVSTILRREGWDAKVTKRHPWRWEYKNGGRVKEYTGTEYVVWRRKKKK